MDCSICFETKLSLKTLPCEHALCYGCYIRLSKSSCPYCRFDFTYSMDDNKKRAKIGLEHGYQSNNTQPGLEIPDEFVFNRLESVGLLERVYITPRTIIYQTHQIEYYFDDDFSSRNKKKNKKIIKKSIDEIIETRYYTKKREHKKWTRKEGRLEKINAGFSLY